MQCNPLMEEIWDIFLAVFFLQAAYQNVRFVVIAPAFGLIVPNLTQSTSLGPQDYTRQVKCSLD